MTILTKMTKAVHTNVESQKEKDNEDTRNVKATHL